MTRDRGDMQPNYLGPLFPERHLSHTTDPQTSREAARATQPRLPYLQQFALDVVKDYPGLTTKEMAVHVSDGDLERVRQQIGRRLNELEKANLIYRKGTREGCALWWPAK